MAIKTYLEQSFIASNSAQSVGPFIRLDEEKNRSFIASNSAQSVGHNGRGDCNRTDVSSPLIRLNP